MHSVSITALEAELPGDLVPDAALAAEIGVDEETVARWSRGGERRESPEGEGPADLAARAARRALDAVSRQPADVGLIVFATNTPDMFFPGSACLLQSLLECPTIGGLDVRSQCTGFLTALDVARRFVATGQFDRVLVAAGDTPSHFNARDGRSPALTCATGDSAAVALVEGCEPGGRAGEVLAVDVRSDGAHHRDYWCEFPASRFRDGATIPGRNRLPASKVEEGRHFPEADLDALHDLAVDRLPPLFTETLAATGEKAVDATFVTHLDARVPGEVAGRLGPAAGRVEIDDLLYSGGASLPVLLARARQAGRVQPGQLVALLTAGSGATWGCAIVRVP